MTESSLEDLSEFEYFYHQGVQVQNAGSKGKGVFATTQIPAGTLLLREEALQITFETKNREIGSKDFFKPLKDNERYWEQVVKANLQELNREAYIPAPKRFERLSKLPNFPPNLGTFLRHALQVPQRNSTNEMRAFGLELSKYNHSCIPNAAWHAWSFDSQPIGVGVELRAMRIIQPGDEISISYSQVMMERDERQRKLNAVYHFDCRCSTCTSNDEGRERILHHLSRNFVKLRPSPVTVDSEFPKDEPWNYFRMVDGIWVLFNISDCTVSNTSSSCGGAV